jgi:hypothetical protein
MPQLANRIPNLRIPNLEWQQLKAETGSHWYINNEVNLLNFSSGTPRAAEAERQPMFKNFEVAQRNSPGSRYEMQTTTGGDVDKYYALPNVLQTEGKFERFREKVAGFAKLPANWDSYGAAPIDSKAVLKAFILLSHLERKDLLPDMVLPTSDESIFVRFTERDQIQEWEFFSSGEVGKLIIGAEGEHTYSDVSWDELRASAQTY